MTVEPAQMRLKRAAVEARSAEEQGDFAATNEAWRRHRLIADTLRDPEALLAEGIALSETALALASRRKPQESPSSS